MEKLRKKNTKVDLHDVLTFFISHQQVSIPEIAKEMELSVPTVTKMVNELIQRNYIYSLGKVEQGEGRPPTLYTINPEVGYFIGVDIKHNYIRIGIIDFSGNIKMIKNLFYHIENTEKSLNELCSLIQNFIKESQINSTLIISIQLNISGRVNPVLGISYTMFSFLDDPISEVLEYKLGHPVNIDNDTRSMFFGEIYKGCIDKEKDIIYINLSWGLGSALMVNGQVIKGKSGFSGELGHFYAFENEILCHCGKRGCLETEVSGSALYRTCIKEIKKGKQSILSDKVLNHINDFTLQDIIDAINKEDVLCIELIEQIGIKLGKQISNLINLLNPELIVIGGALAKTGDYLLLPLKLTLKKYTLNVVNKDSTIILSNLKDEAGIIGACYLARYNFLRDFKE